MTEEARDMAELQQIVKLAVGMGLQGQEAVAFVRKQQENAREERRIQREEAEWQREEAEWQREEAEWQREEAQWQREAQRE